MAQEIIHNHFQAHGTTLPEPFQGDGNVVIYCEGDIIKTEVPDVLVPNKARGNFGDADNES